MIFFDLAWTAWSVLALTRERAITIGFSAIVAEMGACIGAGHARAKELYLQPFAAERVGELFVGVTVSAPTQPHRRRLCMTEHARTRVRERIGDVCDETVLGWIDRVRLQPAVHPEHGPHNLADCGEFVAVCRGGAVVTVRDMPVCGVRARRIGRAYGGFPDAPKVSREHAVARIAARGAGIEIPLTIPGRSWDGHDYSGRVWSEIVEVT
jgi:hypothetical protein